MQVLFCIFFSISQGRSYAWSQGYLFRSPGEKVAKFVLLSPVGKKKRNRSTGNDYSEKQCWNGSAGLLTATSSIHQANKSTCFLKISKSNLIKIGYIQCRLLV